jgi:hypothetical protein
MRQKRILLFVVALACGLGLMFAGCDNNPLPDWEDPWPTGNEAPVISSAAPESAKSGDSVVLSGSGMSATADNNFVLLGAGTGWYLCDVTTASATSITITLPEGHDNLPFDEWTIIDTIMGYHFAGYPDSEINYIDSSEIDTVIGTDTTWVYDTSRAVYTAPETVTAAMAQTSPFEIKMSARGAELWSNSLTFNAIPPDEDREYRWASLVVISKGDD